MPRGPLNCTTSCTFPCTVWVHAISVHVVGVVYDHLSLKALLAHGTGGGGAGS